jgi:hypothetical protein
VFVFPISLTSCFPSQLTLPFEILPLLLLQARKYLIAHSTGIVTTSKTMKGRQKKQGNQFPHSKKLVQEPEGNEEKVLRSRLQQNEDKLCQRTQ